MNPCSTNNGRPCDPKNVFVRKSLGVEFFEVVCDECSRVGPMAPSEAQAVENWDAMNPTQTITGSGNAAAGQAQGG